MAKPVLIDTDVMVDFLRGEPKAVSLIRKYSTRLMMSSIVVAELYAGIRDDEELNKLDSLIGIFKVVPVSSRLARAGGLFRKEYIRSHGVGLADAIIAATAAAESADLKTLNMKHYPMINGLRPAYTKA